MPSAETVEIDASNNDVAILDASDCALAADPSSLLSASLLSSSSSSSNTITQCSQESDMRAAVSDSVNAMKGGDNDDDNDEEGENERPGESGRQVSPMPQKRGAMIVTPRSSRKGSSTTTTTTTTTTAPTKSSSASAKIKGKISSSASSISTSRAKKGGATKSFAAISVKGNDGVDSTAPTTPSSSTISSSTRPSNNTNTNTNTDNNTNATSTSSGAAIATPGGEDSAIKKKKKTEVDVLPKKPKTTLHSFFRKVDPSAKKSVDVKNVETKNEETKNEETRDEVNHVEKKLKKDEVNHVDKKVKNDEAPSVEEKVKADVAKSIHKESKSTTSKVTVIEKSITSSSKGTAPVISEVDKKEKAPAKKKGSTMKSIDSSAVVEGPPSRSSSTSGRIPAIKTQKEEEDDLDDSPAFAVAAALRMVNKRRSGNSRRSSGGNSGHPVVVARSVDDKYTTEMVRTDEKVKEVSSLGDTSAGSREEKENESSNAMNTVVPDVADTVRNDNNAVDIEERGNVDTATPSADASTDVSMDVPDNTPIDFNCSKDEDSGREENSADETVTANCDDAAKNSKRIVEVSHGATKINQQVETVWDSMKEDGEKSAGDGSAIVVDANECGVDNQADESAKEVSDEVKEMSAVSTKATTTSTTKRTTKPRQQKDTSTASAKSSDKKAASVASVKIGQSSIVTSLKKMAAYTPKKSVDPPTAKQTINQRRETVSDSMKADEEQATHDDSAVVVDAVESGTDVEADDSAKKGSDVPAMSIQSTTTCTTKVTPKSRKQKDTSTPSNNSSNLKAATIVTSLTKMTASTPKKSLIPPLPTQTSPSISIEVPSGAKSDSASSSNGTENLSDEDASRLNHYLSLRVKYAGRASELGNLPSSDAFEEENLCLEGSLDKGSVEASEDGGFPDKLLTHLQVMTQGSSQPLSELAKRALDELSPFIAGAKPLTIESISSKIKLLAQRKSYLSRLPTGTFEKSSPVSKLDCFENAENCYMWRWELCSLDLLPQPQSAKVKKARTMRKKLQSHYKAIINLITATDKAIVWLQDSATSKSSSLGATLTAKVSEMEDKVLKFEREEERTRLLKEAELQKQKIKAEELAGKQLEKERIEEEKRNEKKRLEEEKRNEKKRKDEEREQKKAEANRIKNEENEKKKQEIEEKENKRKARMMMFFSNGSSTKKAKVSIASVTQKKSQDANSSFDSDAFHKLIDSQGDHVGLYSFAKVPRRRKTAKVRVSVFVTVLSENAFAPQPYDEERVIVVPNRYKFLGFHEDVRPPYRGTWSKRSSFVTGRRPLGKDTKYLDYDIDSEEEWEEGDDEDGEDLVDGDDGAEEEEDMLNEDDNDGWLAAEDDLGIEDDDDETRELRKKNLYNDAIGRRNSFKACVVAPCMGGLPQKGFDGDNVYSFVEGFTPEEAIDVLSSHLGYVITPDVSICMDAFPPTDSTKDINQTPASQNKEMTVEAQKIMAVFVHNSTLKSRDIVVTELLKLHPSLTSSRAQAVRELDVIATKRRLTNGAGVIWEVKTEHLNKLDLNEKDLKQPPKEASPPTSPVEEGKTKKVKDPNAPKRNASAYLLYSNAARNDVRNANPHAVIADINKILSEQFKALSVEERGVWDVQAAADKERYLKEMAQHVTGAALSDKAVAAEVPVPQAEVADSQPKIVEIQASANQSSATKRKAPVVSKASADLLAKFMKKKQKVEVQQNTSPTAGPK